MNWASQMTRNLKFSRPSNRNSNTNQLLRTMSLSSQELSLPQSLTQLETKQFWRVQSLGSRSHHWSSKVLMFLSIQDCPKTNFPPRTPSMRRTKSMRTKGKWEWLAWAMTLSKRHHSRSCSLWATILGTVRCRSGILEKSRSSSRRLRRSCSSRREMRRGMGHIIPLVALWWVSIGSQRSYHQSS